MSKSLSFLVLAGLVALYIVGNINYALRLDEKTSAAWAEVENQYQRRFDLIPNLVATVKGYAEHENKTLNEVVEARVQAAQNRVNLGSESDFKKYISAQDGLSTALSRLLAVAEAYPELKAEARFGELQSQLEGCENRIAVARRDYIEAVQRYNYRLRVFPAGMMIKYFTDLQPKPVFSVAEEVKKTPEVHF
ncbi:MAG: LemA family protein [Alphaproteobacteria bacterium]|nr:LemA family protein [Alphaproteobacteria bacterium]